MFDMRGEPSSMLDSRIISDPEKRGVRIQFGNRLNQIADILVNSSDMAEFIAVLFDRVAERLREDDSEGADPQKEER